MARLITDCSECGAQGSLETSLKIDLDDVVFDDQTSEVVSFTPAGSANDPDNGIVVETAVVSCRDCGAETTAGIPYRFTQLWVYQGDPVID